VADQRTPVAALRRCPLPLENLMASSTPARHWINGEWVAGDALLKR
jgi:hypothetical protein